MEAGRDRFHDFLEAPTIGAQVENATVHETSQLGNTRKRENVMGRHGEGGGEKKISG